MKDILDLVKTLVWPALVSWFFIALRDPIQRTAMAIAKRVEEGAPIKAGKDGIEVGAAPKLEPTTSEPPAAGVADRANLLSAAEPVTLPHAIYLSHGARRDSSLDRGELEYFRLRVFLDADEPSLLDAVDHVVYHLHRTFRQPRREARDRESSFELRTTAWGEFNILAEIHFKDHTPTLVQERYLTLRVPAA